MNVPCHAPINLETAVEREKDLHQEVVQTFVIQLQSLGQTVYSMAHALFDILVGHYQNGQPVGRYPIEGDLQLSIRDHLQRLLNGRRGVLPHLPGYGMPDVAALYEALPYSLDDLTTAVRQAIETFEKRLGQLQVRPRPLAQGEGRVRLEIFGRSQCGQSMKFIASLFSTGRVRVDLQTERTWHE